jgi:DNA repair protein RadA/Sms
MYVSGEESAEQVKLRAERLKLPLGKMMVLPETHIESIIDSISQNLATTKLIIVDSIQTLWSEELTGTAGSVGQIRECTLKLLEFAKKYHIPILLIGHVTKEGTIAGPKVLEHMVDAVLYLEGERFQTLRLLRGVKNRFGAVDEVGVFSLEEKGLIEVTNPSELFLGKNENGVGSAVICTLEGSRPLLVEVQALTIASQIPVPRRVATGINVNRLQMLLAIIQKHTRLPLGGFDVFVNVASGIKLDEPAADLGMCLAIASSFKGKALPPKTVAIGEVGLLGEIRQVVGVERRIKEAKRLGFKTIISPKEYRSLSAVIKDVLP